MTDKEKQFIKILEKRLKRLDEDRNHGLSAAIRSSSYFRYLEVELILAEAKQHFSERGEGIWTTSKLRK